MIASRRTARAFLFKNNKSIFATRRISAPFTTSYYDSQSGMHIAFHDETKISLYWNGLSSKNSLQTAIDRGMAGALVDAQEDGLLASVPSEFTICNRLASFDDDAVVVSDNILLEYRNDVDDTTNLQEALSGYISKDVPSSTSLGLFQNSLYNQDPILVAAGIGSVMDGVVGTGTDWLWLIPDVDDDDAIVALCQELAYLDLAGPTMKSRLLVQASSEDQVEECLMMGISKFVTSSSQDDEEVVDWLKDVVEEQGKELCLLQ
jgi:hypothetical protein